MRPESVHGRQRHVPQHVPQGRQHQRVVHEAALLLAEQGVGGPLGREQDARAHGRILRRVDDG